MGFVRLRSAWVQSGPKVVHQLFGIPRTCAVPEEVLLDQVLDCLIDKRFHL